MRIARAEVEAWLRPLTGRRGDARPEQRTLHAILRGGELHRFGNAGHVLVCRVGPGEPAHLITTSRLLARNIPTAEKAFIADLLTAWSPEIVWIAWLQRDRTMGRDHEALWSASGLCDVTGAPLRGWAISVDVTMSQLEALIRGA